MLKNIHDKYIQIIVVLDIWQAQGQSTFAYFHNEPRTIGENLSRVNEKLEEFLFVQ